MRMYSHLLSTIGFVIPELTQEKVQLVQKHLRLNTDKAHSSYCQPLLAIANSFCRLTLRHGWANLDV